MGKIIFFSAMVSVIPKYDKRVSISFVHHLPDEVGGEVNIYTRNMPVKISINEINNVADRYGTLAGLTYGMIAIDHEVEHVRNELDDRSVCGDEDRCFLKIANYRNENAYRYNYYVNLDEWFAEYNSIQVSHQYLQSMLPYSNMADDLCLQYINLRCSSGAWFGSPHDTLKERPQFDSYENAISFLRKQELACVREHHDYFPKAYSQSDDALQCLFESNEKWDSIRKQMQNPFACSDEMAACAMVKLHPKLKKRYPVIRDMDLSPMRVFGQPFPVSGWKMRQAVDDSDSLLWESGSMEPCASDRLIKKAERILLNAECAEPEIFVPGSHFS